MFEHDYTLNGIHATRLKDLARDRDSSKEKPYVFDRYIDVYMNAAIWGLLYRRLGSRDSDSKDRARIYADAFATERDTCVFLYRLVMLLDETTGLSPKERVDRAFRDDANGDSHENLTKNMEVFHSYVLGGIEVMHENMTEGCTTQTDFIERLYGLMDKFQEDSSGASYEERLAALLPQVALEYRKDNAG